MRTPPCDCGLAAVALFREINEEGKSSPGNAHCFECVIRAMRVAVDVQHCLLSVTAEPASNFDEPITEVDSEREAVELDRALPVADDELRDGSEGDSG